MNILLLSLINYNFCTKSLFKMCGCKYIYNKWYALDKEIFDSVEDVCRQSKGRSVILLLDIKLDFRIQTYFFDIDDKELFEYFNEKQFYLYKDVKLSDARKTFENMKCLLNRHKKLKFKFQKSFNFKKGRLYIILKENYFEDIKYLADEFVFADDIRGISYRPIKSLIYGGKSVYNPYDEAFIVSTRLLQYVCDLLSYKIPFFVNGAQEYEFSKQDLEQYEIIQENCKAIMKVFDHVDTLKEKTEGFKIIMKYEEFFRKVYEVGELDINDFNFHSHFKEIINNNKYAYKLNKLRIISKYKYKMKERLVEHILICARRFLNIKKN